MFDTDEARNAALRNWARNDRHCTAAVELLIDHGHWPAMLDDAGLLHRFAQPEDDHARPLLNLAIERLNDPDERRMFASSSEERVLEVAASLVTGHKISLGRTLVGLDAGNQMRVARALCAALGGVATVDSRF